MVVDGKSLQEYPVKAAVLQCSILGPAFVLLYIDVLRWPNGVICNTAVYVNDATRYP